MDYINLINYLKGKKTYIVTVIMVCVNALYLANIIQLLPEHITAINYVLGALGLASLRLGISNSNK